MEKFILITLLYLFVMFNTSAKVVHVGEKQFFKTIKSALLHVDNGDTILIDHGYYPEYNIIINHALYIKGINHPIIDGKGVDQIITITSSNVTIDGLILQNGRYSESNDFSMIKAVDINNLCIKNNFFKNSFFAIAFYGTKNVEILNNNIISNAVKETTSGNGIHCLHSDQVVIKNNIIQKHRDGIYFEFVTHSLIQNNICKNNIRYGLHFMFSHYNTYIDNQFINNGTGVAVMYSNSVRMIHNQFIDNWGPASYGILLKEMNDCEIEYNNFFNNTIAIVMETCNRGKIIHNNIEKNGLALEITTSSMDNQIMKNNFQDNIFDVTTNGSQSKDQYSNNYWDKYYGYDMNKDGNGDVPYRPCSVFANITERYPLSMILFRSLIVYLLDKIEKIIPDIIPENLIDYNPKMKPYVIH